MNECVGPSGRLFSVRAARGPGIESTEKRDCSGIAIKQRLEFDAKQDGFLLLVVLKMPDAISYGGFTCARPKKDSPVEILYQVFESVALREFCISRPKRPLVTKHDRCAVYRDPLGARSSFPHQLLASAKLHQSTRRKQLARLSKIVYVILMCEVVKIGAGREVVLG